MQQMLQEGAQCVRLGEVGAAVNKKPRWGCNNREIVLRFVVKGVQEPTYERVPESVKVRNVLKVHCIDLLEG